MPDVEIVTMPERALLCHKRRVKGEAGALALGKEFVALLNERPLPRLEGAPGAVFCIYHGEVNEESDGPLEWCVPVPAGRDDELATSYPELALRHEPAHDEAVVHLGPAGQLTAAQWQAVAQSLQEWQTAAERSPSDLGARVTYHARPPITEESVPDCDFAVPLR